MSDPMTNAEVEDVLSSIRRLVSEDKSIVAPEPEPEDSDRLVLTPALRVMETEEDAQPAENTHHDDSATAEVAADVPAFGEAPDHEVAEEDATPSEEAWAEEDHWEEAADLEEAPNETAQEAELSWPVIDRAERDNTLETSADDDALDMSVEDTVATDVYDAAPSSFETETEAEVVEPQEPVQDGTDPDDHGVDDTSQSLSAKVAALETLIAGQSDEQWEPDGSAPVTLSTAPEAEMVWEDAEEGAPEAAAETDVPVSETVVEASFENVDVGAVGAHEDSLDHSPEETLGDAPVGAFEDAADDLGEGMGEAILDEEALRDMIADVVRQELQGALGERITRNVRKLVRREIHRALAAHELD